MVAGLTCHASAAYNRFVLADQPQLQKSDADLMAISKTATAPKPAMTATRPSWPIWRQTRAAPQATASAPPPHGLPGIGGESLGDFIAGQHLLIAAPESCAVKYDMVEDAAVTGPSYALPAAPYGAPDLAAALPAALPPQMARRQADPDVRQAYNAPQPLSARVRREQQEYLDQGWVYGPYGWVPPRPPRRWSYGGYYD